MKLFPGDKDLLFRINQIRDLARTQTAKNSGYVFAGNIISTGLSVIATSIISRTLGPEEFGRLAIFLSLYSMILGLTDFGLGTAAVKLISDRLEKNKHEAGIVMKVIIYCELLSGVLVGLIGLLFSAQVADLLGGQQLLFPVRMAFVASVFASSGAFIAPFLTSYQQFLKNALFGIANSVAKTAGVALLMGLAILKLNNILIFYTALNIIAFFIGFLLVPRDYKVASKPGENKRALHEIFHFSKWILLSYFASVISSRLDIFLLSRYKGPKEVGIYAAAQQLALIMPLIIGSLTTVLLPRVSRMKERIEFVGYAKKALFASTVLCLALAPLGIGASIIVGIIFGAKFGGSVVLFQILLIGYLVALFTNPLSLIFYAKNRPQVLTRINYVNLVVIVILNFVVIPRYGALGASVLFAVNNALAGLIIIPLSLKQILGESHSA